METLYPSLFVPNSEWYFSQGSEWSKDENKRFERALAIYDEDEPDRWIKVANMIPGKTVYDVIKQYRELEDDVSDIEAGKVPIPGYDHNNYNSANFGLEWAENKRNFDEFIRKRSLGSKSGDQERKKGVPWTEDEHRRFLLGLLKHGKGDWRNISRNFVVSKTPTQVASHAQKYFIRQQLSGVKDKRRPSIHDITTVNFADPTLSEGRDHHKLPPLPAADHHNMHKVIIDWNNNNNNSTKAGSLMLFDSTDANFLVSYPNEIASTGLKFQGQNLYAAAANINPHNLVFQRYQIHG